MITKDTISCSYIWADKEFISLSIFAKLILLGLIHLSDEKGKTRCEPSYIRQALFPSTDRIRIIDVKRALKEIIEKMSIKAVLADGSLSIDLLPLLNRLKEKQEKNQGISAPIFSRQHKNAHEPDNIYNNIIINNKNNNILNNNKNIYIEIINYLNKKVNSKYKYSSKNTQQKINARINEGFTVEDFKYVIDVKSKEWLNTDMAKYLRPETLFGPKFESYLNQKQIQRKTQNNNNFGEIL